MKRFFENGKKHFDFIQILCGPKEKFCWIATDFTNLRKVSMEKQLVVAGHEDEATRYFVGRANCDDGFCIGKVLEHGYLNKSSFYGVDRNGDQLEAEAYEVLVNERKGVHIPKSRNGLESSLILAFPHRFYFVLSVLFSFVL